MTCAWCSIQCGTVFPSFSFCCQRTCTYIIHCFTSLVKWSSPLLESGHTREGRTPVTRIKSSVHDCSAMVWFAHPGEIVKAFALDLWIGFRLFARCGGLEPQFSFTTHQPTPALLLESTRYTSQGNHTSIHMTKTHVNPEGYGNWTHLLVMQTSAWRFHPKEDSRNTA